MTEAPRLLTVQFLKWVAERPRSYAEMREAWRSTCPLTCAWEDAIGDDLVSFVEGHLALTPQGREVLLGEDCKNVVRPSTGSG
jgi:hypothetical protein